MKRSLVDLWADPKNTDFQLLTRSTPRSFFCIEKY